MKLRTMPLEHYQTQDALLKLGYAIVVDLSMNEFDSLPAVVLESLTKCRKLVLAQNRLKSIPTELFYMVS